MSESGAVEPAEDRLLETVLWHWPDRPSLEVCRLWRGAGSFRLEGTVLIAADAAPAEIRYQVLCNEKWETRTARVAVTRAASTRTLELARGDDGRWWRDGAEVEALRGTVDIDLSFTPATNTLPIRRLSLAVGADAAVDAAWLKFPGLELEVLPQRYTRLDALRWRYESAGGRFTAELAVDELGLVVRYGEFWRRAGG